MQVEEEFIGTFSMLLSEFGYFDFEYIGDFEVLYRFVKKESKNNELLKKKVLRYLKEKEEYVKYMCSKKAQK